MAPLFWSNCEELKRSRQGFRKPVWIAEYSRSSKTESSLLPRPMGEGRGVVTERAAGMGQDAG